MDILLCTDDNYIMPCGITMISLLENNKDNNFITFHIIGMNIKENSKEKVSSISSKYKNVKIVFYEINKDLLEPYNFSLYDSKHLSLAAYSRLFIGDILPKSIEKILYLDCDIIITKDLSELWNTDIENHSIAGVPDIYISTKRSFENLGYPEKFGYINSGILLINLKDWNEQNRLKVFLDFYKKNHDKLIFHDQDIINGTLYNRKLLLPIKFNVIDFYYLSQSNNLGQYENEVSNAAIDPVIIHYTSTNKPWFKDCLHPLKGEFLKYKKISPWKDTPIKWSKISFGKKIQYYKRIIFFALKIKKPRYLAIQKELNRKYFF